jgi:hypothetical protein
MTLQVHQQSPEVEAMAEHWPVIAALMGGTAAMRKAGKTYLPQQPREDDADYLYRLNTATLFPAFARTVTVMAGKPFSKQVTLSEDTPARIRALAENIDGEGRSLHVVAATGMEEAVSFGFGGIFVDYTRTEGRARTQADERAMGARPYWINVKHNRILGWKTSTANGITTLTQLRLAESATVDDGEFGTKIEERVRVHEPGRWRLYRIGDGGQAELIEEGTTTLPVIPFVPFYGRRVAYMIGQPPLLDLAHQNVKHWQQQSDQDDSARFARKRLLVFSGVDEAEMATVTAGSSSALRFTSPTASATVVQGSAESVTVGRSELDALEAQMIQTGAELLVRQPGARTATEASNDAEANKSELQRIVEDFEDALDMALQFTAMWLGLPDGGSVSLFKDFAANSLTDASAQLIQTMQQGGLITKQTAIREQQRRGVLSPDIDPEVEVSEAEAEGPPLGTAGGDE